MRISRPKTLYLAKIKSAFEINNIQRGRVICYVDDIQLLRSLARPKAKINPVHDILMVSTIFSVIKT